MTLNDVEIRSVVLPFHGGLVNSSPDLLCGKQGNGGIHHLTERQFTEPETYTNNMIQHLFEYLLV